MKIIIPINGEKCKTIDAMLIEFYDKLDFPYPQYMNLDGLNDWITDLTWIKDSHPDLDVIELLIFNSEQFLSKDAKMRDFYVKDFMSQEYWGTYQRENEFEVKVRFSTATCLEKEDVSTQAAAIYAKGFVRRARPQYPDAPKYIKIIESDDGYMFIAPFDLQPSNKPRYVGTPQCFVIDKTTFDCKAITFQEYIRRKKQQSSCGNTR